MAEITKEIQLLVTLKDLASAQLARLREETAKLEEQTAKMSRTSSTLSGGIHSVGVGARQAGADLTAGLTLPIVGAAAYVIKLGSDYQTNMHILQNETGISTDQMNYLRAGILNLAKEGSAGPIELAKAMYHPVSAGFSMADSLMAVKLAQQESMISGANLEDTVNSLTTTMYTGIKGAQNAHDTMASLNAIVGQGNMRFQDLNGAIGTGFLSSAAGFGIGLKDMGGALDVMVDRGMSATSAATRLRMAITMMSAPSKQAAKILTDMGLSAKDAQDQTSNFAVVLKQAGVTTTQLAEDMRTKGLNATLHELKDRLTTVTGSSALAEAALTKAFGGAKSATSIQLLTDNLGAYDSKLAKINSTTGEFDKSAVDASKTLNNQFHTAVSKVQAALLQAFNPDNHQFDGLGKGISDVGNAITGIINKFAALSPHTQETIIKVLALTAALGPVLWTGGKIIGVFEGFAKIFGGAKVAVEFLVEHGLKPFELIGKVVTTVWTFVAETVIPLVIDGFIALAAAIGVSVGWLIVIVLAIIAVGVAIYELVTHWKQVSKFIMDIWKVVADWLVKTWKGITTEASKAFNAVKKVVIDVMTAIVKAVVAYLDLVTYPFRLALALILAIVIFAFKVIVGSIVIAMTAIYNFVAPILVRIYNFYAGIFTSIYNFLAGIMQAISNFIVSIWNKVYNFYAGILQAISNVIVSAWNAVYKFISGVLQAISNFIVGVWNSIYNTVARIMQGIWNVLVGVWNSIANAISGTINWIMRMVGGVGGGIINTLAGAGGWLVNAGSNVIRGLWNGIAGMAGWLYNNVMGFIRNNVPGPVLKLLGIRSPSTLFAEYGKNTMMGFHQGFMSQGDATQKTTTQVFQTLVNNSKNALGKLTTDMKNMSTLSAAQKGQGGVTQNALSPGANSNTSNTNQKTQLFAPVININMGGGGSAGDMTYAAKQAVLAMQNKALFT